MTDDETTGADPCFLLLTRALRAMASGDVTDIGVFTPDVRAQSPHMKVARRDELEDQLSDRAGTLSNIELVVDSIERTGDEAALRWHLDADHTGPVLVNEDVLVEPSGRHIHVAVSSWVQLRDGRISAFRHDYDDEALMAQTERSERG